jgi:hypothetical protein
VRRALARDREERYSTAHDLARDLDGFVASQGRDDDLRLLTSAILDALFPGEREKQALWLRRAKAGSGAPSTASVAPKRRPSSRPPPKKAGTSGP